MSDKENLLDIALNDPIRKKYGLNIIFADETKKPLQKEWDKWLNKKQTDEDIKKIYNKSHTNYGYLTGFNNLISIDFDAAWIYLEALDYFGERLNTFTVKTPNGGYHAYFFTNKVETYLDYKKSLKVEILGNYNTIVHGKAKTVDGKLKSYVAMNQEPIHRDDDIIKDMKTFLRETLTKFNFLGYKCIFNKLQQKINHLTHEQRLNLSNLFLQRGASSTTTTNFFRMCSDFDQKITKYQVNRDKAKVEDGILKYPTCDTLAKNFDFNRDDCAGCIRLLKKETTPKKPKIAVKKDKDGEISKMTAQRLYEEVMNLNKRISHGMHNDPEYGLMYTTRIEGQFGIYGIARNKFVKAIYEGDIVGIKVKKDKFIVKGYISPLSDSTRTGIVQLTQTIDKSDKFQYDKISDLFEDLLDKVIFFYLDFKDNTESLLVTLWILGTYYRVFWTWYPYITFAGLRDVGKSTALTILSNTCFNGSGNVSGAASEASILRKASSSKGILIIDHYEEIKKNQDKRQIYTQLLENAWRLNASAERVNTITFEVESFVIPCSIGIGTRYEDEVLDEKGIKITMYDTTSEEIVERSSELDDDPYFINIQQRCMATALMYQDKVFDAYHNIPRIKGLYGRDRNKFKPLLALAMVIDSETENKWKLFEKISEYGIEYRENRKTDVMDLEEVLLKVILEWNIKNATLPYLGKKVREEGYKYYGWQSVKADIRKLGIIKWIDRKKKPVVYHIDLEKCKERAKQRGIQWGQIDTSEYDETDLEEIYEEDEYKSSDDDFDESDESIQEKIDDEEFLEDLNAIQQDIVKIVNNKVHQTRDGAVMRTKIVDIIEAMYETDRDVVEGVIDELKDYNKVYEPRIGFLKIRKK